MSDLAKEMLQLGDRLFAKKASLDSLHQTIADLIYPERANFTRTHTDGDEYADGLYESIPPQARRDLAGAIGAILRPRGKEWFKPEPADEWRRTQNARVFCDYARDVMRRQLYSGRSRFQKTMADCDDDFVAFGNAVPILTEAPDRSGYLFELTHLRDNAWSVNRYFEVDVNHRKFKKTLRAVAQQYGEAFLTESQKKRLEKTPYEEIELRHVVMPAADIGRFDMPRGKLGGKPYASLYINPEAATIMKVGGYWEFPILHRRWRVRDDSVYGYSPAATLGLVDGRVLQSQARVIMDAGELAVAPPLLAKRDAVLGGVKNYPASVTWIDMEYDERFGDAVRPLDTGSDVRIGLDMKIDTRQILQAAFFLNKLSLPSDKQMTAYEASERIAEYVRSAGPVFEPFEADNERTLSTLFQMNMRLGYFGPIESIPPEIKAGEINWQFDTPVSQAYKRIKVQKARESVEMIKPIAEIKPEVLDNVDFDRMTRDTFENLGGEAAWLVPQEKIKETRAQRAEQAAQIEEMQKADAMASLADKVAGAGQKAATAAPMLPQLQAMFGQQQPQQPVDPLDDYPDIEDPFADIPGAVNEPA